MATVMIKPPLAAEIVKDVNQWLWFIAVRGIQGGLAFLFIKFAYGIYHNYGFNESINALFTGNGLIVFGIGFVAGVAVPFLNR